MANAGAPTGGIGTELEHAIGFNGGLPGGLYVLPSAMPVPGSQAVADASNPRYIVSQGSCALINSMTDPHEQVFYRGHRGAVCAMALSSSGRFLATGESSYDSDVIVWDVPTGRILHRFQEHDHGISSLSFSDDERLLFVCGIEADGWMHIIDLATGAVAWKHQNEPAPLLCSAFGGFARDVKGRETALYQFATAGAKGLCLWAFHPVSGECAGTRVGRTVPNSLARDYLCLAWTPREDKAWIYAGTASGDLVVIHVKSKDIYHSVTVCGGGICSVAAVPDYPGSGAARYLPPRSTRDYGGREPLPPEAVNVLVVAGGGDGSVSLWSHAISTIDTDSICAPPVSASSAEVMANGRATLNSRTFVLLRTCKLDGPVWGLAPLQLAAPGSGAQRGLALLASTSSGNIHRLYANDGEGQFAAFLGTARPGAVMGTARPQMGGPAGGHGGTSMLGRGAAQNVTPGDLGLAGGVGAVAANPGGLSHSVFRQAHACAGDGYDPSRATTVALAAKPGAPAIPAYAAASSVIGQIFDVSFAPTLNDKVATAGADNTVRVWDLSDYDCTAVTHVRSVGHPKTVVFATDFTLSGWEDGALRVYFADPHNYSAVTAEGLNGPPGASHGTVGSVPGRIDPKLTAREAAGITAKRAGHEDAGFLWAIAGAHNPEAGGVTALGLSHNRRFCVSGGGDSRVRVWDMRSREMVCAFAEHSAMITGIAVYRDDAHVISASRDKSFMCWDLRKEARISAHTQRSGGINAVAISRDQSLVMTVGKEKRLQLWDLRESSPVQSFGPVHGPDGEGTCVAGAHGKDVVATGGTDGVVRLWDLRMGKAVSELIGHSGVVNKVAWSPDDRQLASVGSDGALLLWNIFM